MSNTTSMAAVGEGLRDVRLVFERQIGDQRAQSEYQDAGARRTFSRFSVSSSVSIASVRFRSEGRRDPRAAPQRMHRSQL